MKRLLLAAATALFIGIVCYTSNFVTTWLADQVDQVQTAAKFFQMEARYFYGPFMSGTSPPVHTLGPWPAVIFAWPIILLGATPALSHLWLQLVLAAAVIYFIDAVCARWGMVCALLSLLLIVSQKSLWWNFSMYWINVLILVFSLIQWGHFLKKFPNFRDQDIFFQLLVTCLGLQVHAVYLVQSIVLFFCLLKCGPRQSIQFFRNLLRSPRWVLVFFMIMAPYVIAELRNKFKNTSAIIGHFNASTAKNHEDGLGSLKTVLQHYVDQYTINNLAIFELSMSTWQFLILLMVGLFVVVQSLKLKRSEKQSGWMIFFAMIFICAHGLFFLIMNRPILGTHYIAFALTASSVLLISFVDILKSYSRITYWMVVIATASWFFAAPKNFKGWGEFDNWSWQTIEPSLRNICEIYGQNGVRTSEGPGLIPYEEKYVPVLAWSIAHFSLGCSYDSNAKTLLRAERRGAHSQNITVDNKVWNLKFVTQPNIGVYQEE